jgi:hypothetical protein
MAASATLGHINVLMAKWLPPEPFQESVKAMALAVREKFEMHRSVGMDMVVLDLPLIMPTPPE